MRLSAKLGGDAMPSKVGGAARPWAEPVKGRVRLQAELVLYKNSIKIGQFSIYIRELGYPNCLARKITPFNVNE